MSNFLISLCIGLGAALLDTLPMMVKKLDRMFILSAFSMWVFVGIASSYWSLSSVPVINGLCAAFLFFIPLSFLIYRLDSRALLQVCLSTIFLGCLVGWASGFFLK